MSSRVTFYETLPLEPSDHGEHRTRFVASLGCETCEAVHVASAEARYLDGAEHQLACDARRAGWKVDHVGPDPMFREVICADGLDGVCPDCAVQS